MASESTIDQLRDMHDRMLRESTRIHMLAARLDAAERELSHRLLVEEERAASSPSAALDHAAELLAEAGTVPPVRVPGADSGQDLASDNLRVGDPVFFTTGEPSSSPCAFLGTIEGFTEHNVVVREDGRDSYFWIPIAFCQRIPAASPSR